MIYIYSNIRSTKTFFFNLNSITSNIVSYHIIHIIMWNEHIYLFCRRGTWSPFYYQVDQYIGPGLAWSYCGLISWPLLNITDSFGLIETNPEHLDRFCLPTKTVFFFNGRKIKKKTRYLRIAWYSKQCLE